MALRAMMKAKALRAKQAELEALLATREELATREADLAKAIEDAGMQINVKAPTPEAPSVGKAIELYLQNNA